MLWAVEICEMHIAEAIVPLLPGRVVVGHHAYT